MATQTEVLASEFRGVAPDLRGFGASPATPQLVTLREYASDVEELLERLGIERAAVMAELYDELSDYPGVRPVPTHHDLQLNDIVLPLKLQDLDGTGELSFFSTLSTFGTPADVTLSELAIEAFYPANAHTAMRLMRDIAP